MPNAATPHLLAAQAPDGGWGAYVGGASRTEATALATLALALAADPGSDAAVDAGRSWLENAQSVDGSWPLGADGPGPNWSASLATLALHHLDPSSAAATRGLEWLVREEGRGSPVWARVLRPFLRDRPAVELDPDLIGWPWASDTFSWVEPTSYALLAIKARRPRPGREAWSRVEEAERMLLDRVCSGGGWNYGNSVVLDEELWPYPDTTALALLALANRPDHPAVAESLDRLPGLIAANGSILSLGLGALALAALGSDAGPTRARLQARLAAWTSGETRALAWGGLGAIDRPDPLGVRGA